MSKVYVHLTMDFVWAIVFLWTYFQVHDLRKVGIAGPTGEKGEKGDDGDVVYSDLHALEWTLLKFGQGEFLSQHNITDKWWLEREHTDFLLNGTNITMMYVPPPSANRRRRLLDDMDVASEFRVHGKMHYFKPMVNKYIEVVIAPESLGYVLDTLGFSNSSEWHVEEFWHALRQHDDAVNVSRAFNFGNATAITLLVTQNARVEGTFDSIGQMNNFGTVDFWPEEYENNSFSFEKSLKKRHNHHISINEGTWLEDGAECACTFK